MYVMLYGLTMYTAHKTTSIHAYKQNIYIYMHTGTGHGFSHCEWMKKKKKQRKIGADGREKT